jgi:hypothetical protein
MPSVALEILEPLHDANIAGSSVRLRSRQTSTGHPSLFYKWYSSQVSPPGGSQDASIRVPAGGVVFDMTVALPVGTQVLTFTAKDQPGESVPEMKAVVHAGMAGGPAPASQTPCVIHVLRANLIAPANGALVSKASGILEVEAPPQWQDASFQAINQVAFQFRFDPTGAPAGRSAADFAPAMAFDNTVPPPRLRYSGPLPATLGTGSYQLTLTAHKTGGTPASHSATRAITLTP